MLIIRHKNVETQIYSIYYRMQLNNEIDKLLYI